MPLLHPAQRKSFTISKDTATWLASKLANGQKLRFQSTANRNWVNKIAKTQYGVNTKVFVVKDQLFDPARTVEGFDINPGNPHYMTLYCAELAVVEAPRVHVPRYNSINMADYVR